MRNRGRALAAWGVSLMLLGVIASALSNIISSWLFDDVSGPSDIRVTLYGAFYQVISLASILGAVLVGAAMVVRIIGPRLDEIEAQQPSPRPSEPATWSAPETTVEVSVEARPAARKNAYAPPDHLTQA